MTQILLRRGLSRAGLVLAIVAGAVAFAPDVEGAGNQHRVYMGYQQTSIIVTQSWTGPTHSGSEQAIDFGKAGNPWGYAVRFRSQNTMGSATMSASKGALGGTTCTGNEIWVIQGSNIMGRVRYVHMTPLGGVPGSWTMAAGGAVTEQTLGTISGSQPVGCPWSAPHLHQQDASAGTANTSFFSLGSSHNYGASSTWMFQYDF